MQLNLRPLFVLVGIATVLAACSNEHSKKEVDITIPGKYAGSYRGGNETFNLYSDGTFDQRFCRKDGSVVYEQKGAWKKGTSNTIYFEPFMGNESTSEKDLEKYQTYASGPGIFVLDPVRIEFGEWPYFATKLPAKKQE